MNLKLFNFIGVISFLPIWVFRGNLNYIEIFTGRRSNFLDLTINSLIVSSCVSVVCGIFGSLCAYSLNRLNVPKFITISIL